MLMKRQILDLMFKSGAFAPVRYLNRAKTPILMYHRFSRDEEPLKTSQAALTAQLEYLTENYKIISLADYADSLKNNKPIPANAAVITIDDGYNDAYKFAYPILKKFSVPATLFVVTDFVDGKCWIWTDKMRYVLLETNFDEINVEINGKRISAKFSGKESRISAAGKINTELKKLPDEEKNSQINILAEKMSVEIPVLPTAEFAAISWEEAREMDAGVLQIESHTVTHPILPETGAEQLKFELETSKQKLENILQRKAKIFCYPNGNNGEREQQAVEAAGYVCAVSTELRLCGKNENLFALPRLDTESEMRRFVQAVSGFDELKFKTHGNKN